MRIRDFTPPNRTEIAGMPKDAAWASLDLYMAPVFEQIKLLTQALQGKISAENANDEVKEITVQHEVPVEIMTGIKGRPTGATLIAFSDPCFLSQVRPVDAGKISVTVSFDDGLLNSRQVTILVKGA